MSVRAFSIEKNSQKNDKLRTKAEDLFIIFRLDKHENIIVITAFRNEKKITTNSMLSLLPLVFSLKAVIILT